MTARATTHVVAPMISHSHQSCNRPENMPRLVEARREACERSKGVPAFVAPFLPSDSLEASIVEFGCSQAVEVTHGYAHPHLSSFAQVLESPRT